MSETIQFIAADGTKTKSRNDSKADNSNSTNIVAESGLTTSQNVPVIGKRKLKAAPYFKDKTR